MMAPEWLTRANTVADVSGTGVDDNNTDSVQLADVAPPTFVVQLTVTSSPTAADAGAVSPPTPRPTAGPTCNLTVPPRPTE